MDRMLSAVSVQLWQYCSDCHTLCVSRDYEWLPVVRVGQHWCRGERSRQRFKWILHIFCPLERYFLGFFSTLMGSLSWRILWWNADSMMQDQWMILTLSCCSEVAHLVWHRSSHHRRGYHVRLRYVQTTQHVAAWRNTSSVSDVIRAFLRAT